MLLDEDGRRLGVGEYPLDLAGRQAEVERHHRDSGLGRAEEQLPVLGGVAGQVSDPVPGAQAGRHQPGRDPVGPLAQLAVGDVPALADHRGRGGDLGGVAADHVRDGAHLLAHAVSWFTPLPRAVPRAGRA